MRCMGWLRLVGSLKLYVSLENIGLFCRALLQKRPIFLRSLLMVATPYLKTCEAANARKQMRGMGWLRLVGSLKLQVSLAEYHLFYRALLQKRPIILRSLLIVVTPYLKQCEAANARYRVASVSRIDKITCLFCRV